MENPTTGNYKEAKLIARSRYQALGRIWCRALDDPVVFTREGFQHLIRKRGIPRSRKEQCARSSLLPYAGDLLRDASAKVIERKKPAVLDGSKIILPPATFWALTGSYDGKLVTVVIRQFDGKEKHFFSVYSKKQKPATGADF
jgi:hypothetical protein